MNFIVCIAGGPRFVESLRPQILTSVGLSFQLRCEAITDDMLDIAYIWTHNGIRIRDYDVRASNNRIVISQTPSIKHNNNNLFVSGDLR